MTDQTRLRVALCISLFLHFMLLHAHWVSITPRMGKGGRLEQKRPSSAPLFSETVSVAIESMPETTQPGDGAYRRQKARSAYLDAVAEAVHSRRFVSADAAHNLIGLAWFSFTIAPDGIFHDVSLTNSSGSPVLDRAAEAAIKNASGVVERPASLGDEEIRLVMAVKYQYDL